jgi:signal transduction histidine kinase
VKSHIFVVEDHPNISRLLRHHLEAAGFSARLFFTGARVLAEAERQRPMLFLLDIMVPGFDGLELCRRIRQTPNVAMTPVIFLTAKSGEADRVLGLELGADDYIAKRFSEQRFDPQPTTARGMLNEAVQSFREIARSSDVELVIDDRSEGKVNADREAVHQVFTNLIDNALQYAPLGRRIVLGARPAEDAVEFYVQDFGPGIPAEHLSRLFERFYRVDKARSRESGGTGLGLAIAKHIVLAHGGSIRAESELNHGSMFLFRLPKAEVSSQ